MYPTCPSSLHSIVTPHYTSIPSFSHHHHHHRRLRSSIGRHVKNRNPRIQSLLFLGRNPTNWVCSSNSFEASQQTTKPHKVSRTWSDSRIVSNCSRNDVKDSFLGSVSKSVVFTLFWIVIGLCPIRGRQPPAVALPAISELFWRKKGKIVKEEPLLFSLKDHEYSRHTRSLLKKVSGVLRDMEAVRAGERDIEDMEVALKEVTAKRNELQDEIMDGLHVEVKKLNREKGELIERADKVLDSVLNAKREQDKLLLKLRVSHGGGDRDQGLREAIDRLVEELDSEEQEYNSLLEKVGEIEDNIFRRETRALSFGVRELSSIARECELLVRRFTQEIRHGVSSPKTSGVAFSRHDIQKDLEAAQKEHFKQKILPRVVEIDDALGPLFDGDQINFALRIKHALEESKDMQNQLEACIRKEMKKYGDEKSIILNTPEGEVVKGFPEVELKWMFGKKEIVLPKTISIHLYDGWKRWREEEKTSLKKSLLENSDLGKQYMAERQEHIILDRDRIVSKTLYNEEKKRNMKCFLKILGGLMDCISK